MRSLTAASSTTWNYTYRADGMRVKKSKNSGLITTAYRYDGQKPIEEYNDGAGWPRTFLQVIRYGLGARGIDFIQRVTNTSVVTTGYPLYDTHGNMIATLAKSGGSYSINDQRLYDVWGGVRTGNTTGEPNPRHCANLGHLQDDESGFVYMRARYYEPASGRFLTEDPAAQGINFFIYAGNNPVSQVDASGKWFLVALIILAILVAAYFIWSYLAGPSSNPVPPGAPLPGVTGELAGAAEGGPAVARTYIRELEKQQVMKDLIDNPYGNGPSDTFDTDDSKWQHPDVYRDPDRYIPGAPSPSFWKR